MRTLGHVAKFTIPRPQPPQNLPKTTYRLRQLHPMPLPFLHLLHPLIHLVSLQWKTKSRPSRKDDDLAGRMEETNE